MARAAASGAKTPKYPPEPFDWYVEEPWAVDLLFDHEKFEGTIYDPACGLGTVPVVATARGFHVFGSDLVDRIRAAPFPYSTLDFLDPSHALWDSCDNIVCNPPYSYQKGIAARFIRRALQVARRKVAVIVPTKFLSSRGRYLLFTETHLARVYTLSSRPSMPPGSLLATGKVKHGGGIVDYCWMVWDKQHSGPTTKHFLIRAEDLARERKRVANRAKKEAA